VYRVLGAGDAFLAGFLRGYLRDEPHEVSARLGNACGAIVVSRLLCSSEFPTLPELNYYLVHRGAGPPLRTDPHLSHLHWATTRPSSPSTLCLIDATSTLRSVPVERRAAFAGLLGAALRQAGDGGTNFGWIGDATSQLLAEGLWQARAFEADGAASLAVRLIEWPAAFTVATAYRCGGQAGAAGSEGPLVRLHEVCRAQRRELLVELE